MAFSMVTPTNVGGYKNAVDIKFIMYRYVFIQKTKEKNKKEFFGTRDELLNSGYSPCGSCHP